MLNTRKQVYLHLQSTVHQDRDKIMGLQDEASIASTSTTCSTRMC